MFTTCLFCHASLGSNASMRTFPIGRRVAFDAERGRLWVVCRRCARWTGIIETRGAEAAQLASQLLAQLNREGGSRRQVDEAVKHLTTAGTAEEFIAHAARLHEERRRSGAVFSDSEFGALGLTDTERLALEMAVNEDAERRAMKGELRPLEQAWRDAEEIASIADNLLVPDRVRSTLARLRSRRSYGRNPGDQQKRVK